MMGEIGKVVKKEEGYVTVSIERTGACDKCRACAAGLSGKEMLMRAVDQCGADVGDTVRVELKDGYFAKAIMIMYGLPLLFMVFGFITGYMGAGFFGYGEYGEGAAFLTGVALLFAAYRLISKCEKKFKGKAYVPTAVEKWQA